MLPAKALLHVSTPSQAWQRQNDRRINVIAYGLPPWGPCPVCHGHNTSVARGFCQTPEAPPAPHPGSSTRAEPRVAHQVKERPNSCAPIGPLTHSTDRPVPLPDVSRPSVRAADDADGLVCVADASLMSTVRWLPHNSSQLAMISVRRPSLRRAGTLSAAPRRRKEPDGGHAARWQHMAATGIHGQQHRAKGG